MISPNTKGKSGEREIADVMNFLIYQVVKEMGGSEEEALRASRSVQRNQNQTAVGGSDLSNTFGLAIEVKRQEHLAVGAWWRQCVESAERNNEMPVLVYRQNRQQWTAMTYGWLPLADGKHIRADVEFDFETFKRWLKEWIRASLANGAKIRT